MKKTVKIKCPNCKNGFDVRYGSNRWVEWFSGECWTCGYRFLLKDYEFDYVQPNSPFFEMIYEFHPAKQAQMEKKRKEWEKQKYKEELEEKHWNQVRKGELKPWDLKNIKSYTESRGL